MHAWMIEALIGSAAGLACGLVFFGGLWLTVVRLPRLNNPKRVFYTSLAARMSLVLLTFKAALDVSPMALWAAIVALLLVRTALAARISIPVPKTASQA